ncbi:hypothetical protein BV20DRAFT_1048323 [Pilatotrama ljubarskyi]|nr:hypothetical protein BV20DRAFT_1048323 [Pilatotrama ljubarskyi]
MNHGLSAYTPSETPSAVTTPASDSNDSQLRDASIFVGSLPTSFTQAELTQRLTDHLSGHIPIKATKVVRDSRGGVCAFIQCENPGAVSSLLQELRMHPPRPFHGRFLRFEAAKAFRTILISYRIPAGVRAADSDADDPFHSPNGNRFGNLKLPHAMRIFQPSNSRHLGILYDAEALALSGSRAAEDLEFHANPLSTEEGLLISPLKYDEETIKRVVTAFGPLESFKECSTNLEVMKGPVPSNSYPHDGPRSTEMSKGVWEVKWKDREHSVAALQTLRRLPFLTLTWAHHPPSVWGFRKTENSHARSSWSPPPARQGPPGLRIPRALEDRFSSPVASPSPPPALATSSVIIKATAAMVSTPSSGPTASSKESSTTSSPLLGFGCDANSPGGAHTCWADQVAELDALTDSIGCTPSSPKHALLTTTDDATDALSSLNLPTPGGRVRALAPATPNMARAQQVPSDARTRPAVMASRDSQCGPTSEMMGDRDLDALPLSPAGPPSRDIDPKTIFVGGLSVDDADEWNEHRLRGIFNRYGAIDNIQVVRSLHKRTCFAFVQFVNPDFASRAVQAEVNALFISSGALLVN